MIPITEQKSWSILHVRITPKAAHERIGEIAMDAGGHAYLKVYVTSAPENGQANTSVIKLLSKKLGVSASSLTIISGLTDRNKRIKVQMLAGELYQRLNQATGTLF